MRRWFQVSFAVTFFLIPKFLPPFPFLSPIQFSLSFEEKERRKKEIERKKERMKKKRERKKREKKERTQREY